MSSLTGDTVGEGVDVEVGRGSGAVLEVILGEGTEGSTTESACGGTAVGINGLTVRYPHTSATNTKNAIAPREEQIVRIRCMLTPSE